MKKVDNRVEQIKMEHEELLKMSRACIEENKNNFIENVDQLMSVLDFDEKNVKNYKAMVSSQELVASLTKEILEAKSVEEVLKIREKLSYYINKIKAELKKREIEQSKLDNYQENSNYLRKDIAKYIRFLKRGDNIIDIEKLYNNYDNLTVEELEKLKKALRTEKNYNVRNLNAFNKEKTKAKGNLNDFNKEKTEAKENVNVALKKESSIDKSTKSDSDTKIKKSRHISEIEFSDINEFLEERVNDLSSQYNITNTFDYNIYDSRKNIVNFFCNIPRYIHNKKALKKMKRDYNVYYSGNDLVSFMEYVKRRNSIFQSLKCIFSRSYLYSQENKCLNNHDKCSWWVFNFCKKHSMNLLISDKYNVKKYVS